jgi:hypothetical protein
MFTAALEAAAFVVNDLRQLITIGLSKIPADSRVARSVKLACELYDKETGFKDARNALVKDSKDLGWFQAPANLGFMVLGLLYGEGDFGRTVCCAVNCGDDTDCTAATAGAILGIMRGRNGIPEKWTKPIGNSIRTVAVDPVYARQLPKSLDELTERVVRLVASVQYENPQLLRIGKKPSHVSREHFAALSSGKFAKEQIWTKSPYELTFEMPFGIVKIDYENGPEVTAGEAKKIKLSFASLIVTNKSISLKWQLPEDWDISVSREVYINSISYMEGSVEQTIIPGNFEGAYFYLPLEVKVVDRNNRVTLNIPFQKKGVITYNPEAPVFNDNAKRHLAKIRFKSHKMEA